MSINLQAFITEEDQQLMESLMPTKQIKSDDIYNTLHGHYVNSINYKIDNVFLFHDWESDYVVVKANGYVYEIEVKISRSDFFADFNKKHKHEILQYGKYVNTYDNREKEINFRPNKFYYCFPKGLISRHEVPLYAGILEFDPNNNCIFKKREAKMLHTNIIDIEKKLCKKFYYKWLDARYDLKIRGIEPKLTNEIKTEEE